jgi:hypothetical protein
MGDKERALIDSFKGALPPALQSEKWWMIPEVPVGTRIDAKEGWHLSNKSIDLLMVEKEGGNGGELSMLEHPPGKIGPKRLAQMLKSQGLLRNRKVWIIEAKSGRTIKSRIRAARLWEGIGQVLCYAALAREDYAVTVVGCGVVYGTRPDGSRDETVEHVAELLSKTYGFNLQLFPYGGP